MAVTVDFYTLRKRINSTKLPVTPVSSFSCVLKDDCSIVNPIVGIHNGAAWNPSALNYAAIGSFGRFYFVTDWTYSEGLWWAALSVDVLATYTVYINNSTQYVARASKTFDGDIADTLYPAKATSTGYISYWPTSSHTPWQRSFSSGFYIVGIINSDSGSIGAVSYYAFTPAQFASLKSFLLSDVTWTDIMSTNPDLGENLYKSLFNPFQYISSVNWFPLSWQSSWGTSITTLKFGWWEITNMACYRLSTYLYSFAQNILAGAHPQSSERGAYLNGSPYTVHRLLAPPFGEFTLDSSIILNAAYSQYDSARAASLSASIQVDFISGQGDMYVSCNVGGENMVLLHTQSPVAVPIQIAQINSNGWGSVRNAVETGANIVENAANLNLGGAISNTVTGILNGVEMRIPHAQERGNNGSIGIYQLPFALFNIFSVMADDARADKGRPLCREVTLSTLADGYVQTVGAHVEIPGTDTEIRMINEFLDNGIYLETGV